MRAILDGDLLAYEVGFASEVGWKAKSGRDEIPSFDYVLNVLLERIAFIMRACEADTNTIYITEGTTFRYALAKTKPYKGNRKSIKPFHHRNLIVYMRDMLGAKSIPNLEADDCMAIDHVSSEETILCSRDKDLMTIPGRFYKWELGKGASWGPGIITQEGFLILSDNKKKLSGGGYSWFLGQMLIGDSVDNILGCNRVGPVKAYEVLNGKSPAEQLEAVKQCYQNEYGDQWEETMLESGALLWIVRRLDPNGNPIMWTMEMTE